MTDDPDDVSEQLDPDVLGDATGDEDRDHTINFPPDEPLGVDDPTLTGSDDVASREDRTDDETASADDVSAEEAAMHIEEPPD